LRRILLSKADASAGDLPHDIAPIANGGAHFRPSPPSTRAALNTIVHPDIHDDVVEQILDADDRSLDRAFTAAARLSGAHDDVHGIRIRLTFEVDTRHSELGPYARRVGCAGPLVDRGLASFRELDERFWGELHAVERVCWEEAAENLLELLGEGITASPMILVFAEGLVVLTHTHPLELPGAYPVETFGDWLMLGLPPQIIVPGGTTAHDRLDAMRRGERVHRQLERAMPYVRWRPPSNDTRN